MRRVLLSVVILAGVAVAPAVHAQGAAQTAAPAPKAVDVTGNWSMNLEIEMGNATPTLALKQDGTKITGTYTGRYGEFALQGTIDEKRVIQFAFSMSAEGQNVTMSFAGEVAANGETMTKGTCTIEGLGDGTWTAARMKK